ncbi:helicase HerA-like domain-containing protein, partial [Streptomyces mirabilis]|uniref:helicase HerA-like domain-containing protein n=1 Tax=Streptomyces mirabilis TaxID=68239 RepID=UPI0033F20953
MLLGASPLGGLAGRRREEDLDERPLVVVGVGGVAAAPGQLNPPSSSGGWGTVFSTFLMWMLADLFHDLPEVG